MGTSLNGLTPAGTYPGLIKTGDNAPIDGTLKTLSDGNGNNLPMAVSTTAVNFTNQLQQSGVAVPTASQVAAKQDTLVSGTNIKTINGTSLLGSGNIPVVTSPSGVAGAIQFSNGSAFASDASNLFWDDTNNRLGIGTNAPTARAHIKGVGATSSSTSFLVQNSLGHNNLKITDDGAVKIENDFANNKFVIGWPDGSESLIFDYTTIRTGGGNPLNISGLQTNIGSYAGTRLTTSNTGTTIYGSGSTSATTSLLVQNSAGAEAFRVYDDRTAVFSSSLSVPNATISTVAITCSSGVFAPSGANGVKWGNNVYAISSTNGILKLSDNSDADFNRLQFGGTTSAYPSLKRSATTLQARLADDSGYSPFDASLYKVGGTNGFTGTGSYTNFTIVGGIITNAS